MDATSSPSAASGKGSRTWLSLAIVAGLILTYLAVINRSPATTGTDGPEIGRHVPYLQLEPLTGDAKPVSQDDLPGHVTLVNYWGTWCGPCVEEFPELVVLAARFGRQPDFQFCAVSCGSDSDADLSELRQATREFLQEQHASIPTYSDQNAASRRALFFALDLEPGDFGYPTTMIFDRQGVIRGFWRGYHRNAVPQMTSLIETLLSDSSTSPR